MLKKIEDTSQSLKVSFRAKTESTCPVCSGLHYKEDLLSGGGRLIAGKLTREFRREYLPSKKYGIIYPMAYAVQVCPTCLFAAYPKDFIKISEVDDVNKLKRARTTRFSLIKTLFGDIRFDKDRNLLLGLASYILAIDCYFLRNKSVAPSGKIAISSLRVAWLSDELFKRAPYRPYDKLRDFYYKEAMKNYKKLLEYSQSGEEPVENINYMLGPDIDHNWGFDGVLYLNGYLIYKYYKELHSDIAEQSALLKEGQRYVSKIYGLGKASSTKPAEIVNMSKDLYTEMANLVSTLDAKIVESNPKI